MQFFKNISNIKLAFFGINKLSSIIRIQKDLLPPFSHSNLVYKLRCAQRDASYVGQTCRLLKLELMNIEVISEETRIRAPLLLNTTWNFHTILTGIMSKF